MEKNTVSVFLLVGLLGFTGCASLEPVVGHFHRYVELDRRTYELIGKEYEAYALDKKENVLTPDQINLRKKALESWKIRIDKTMDQLDREIQP